jgi:hypothetical protein
VFAPTLQPTNFELGDGDPGSAGANPAGFLTSYFTNMTLIKKCLTLAVFFAIVIMVVMVSRLGGCCKFCHRVEEGDIENHLSKEHTEHHMDEFYPDTDCSIAYNPSSTVGCSPVGCSPVGNTMNHRLRSTEPTFAPDARNAEELDYARRLRLLRKSERLFQNDVMIRNKVLLKKRGLVLSDFM